MKFYVYAYLDESERINKNIGGYFFEFRPIYIGKGSKKRDVSHLQYRKYFDYLFYRKLNSMINKNNKPKIIRISYFENESDALKFESNLIKEIGNIKNNGYLYNLTDGGAGLSGFKHSPETKKILSENGKNRKLTKEHRDNISKSLKNKQKPIGFAEKISKIKSGKSPSDESKKKMSDAKKGKAPWNKGKIKDVILQLDFENNILKEWNSLTDLKCSGFQVPNILKCCIGERNSHKGYIWKYKSELVN